jgi:flavodoxin/ferredoxin
MRTLIICFSQTGNTMAIANCIKDGILKSGEHICDLKPFEQAEIDWLPAYDLIGLGSPVFYYKEPFNISDFIRSLPDLKGQKWFVFCTHGNVIGNFFPSISDKLKRKNANIIGYFNSYANITVPFYPKPSYTSGHPDEIDRKNANNFGEWLDQQISASEKNSGNEEYGTYKTSSAEWVEDSKRITREYLKNALPPLSINLNACDHCHACERVCPVQGINLDSTPPRLQDPCIYCWRCVNICPRRCITADFSMLFKMAPEYYARYKTELEKEASEGSFRWLIDPKEIDFENPLFLQRQKRKK